MRWRTLWITHICGRDFLPLLVLFGLCSGDAYGAKYTPIGYDVSGARFTPSVSFEPVPLNTSTAPGATLPVSLTAFRSLSVATSRGDSVKLPLRIVTKLNPLGLGLTLGPMVLAELAQMYPVAKLVDGRIVMPSERSVQSPSGIREFCMSLAQLLVESGPFGTPGQPISSGSVRYCREFPLSIGPASPAVHRKTERGEWAYQGAHYPMVTRERLTYGDPIGIYIWRGSSASTFDPSDADLDALGGAKVADVLVNQAIRKVLEDASKRASLESASLGYASAAVQVTQSDPVVSKSSVTAPDGTTTTTTTTTKISVIPSPANDGTFDLEESSSSTVTTLTANGTSTTSSGGGSSTSVSTSSVSSGTTSSQPTTSTSTSTSTSTAGSTGTSSGTTTSTDVFTGPQTQTPTTISFDSVTNLELPRIPLPTFDMPSLNGGGSCPAPLGISVHGKSLSVSFKPVCDFAAGIRGLVIGVAVIIAAYIAVGARRDG